MADLILGMYLVVTAATGLGFLALGIRSIMDARKGQRREQPASERLIQITRRAS